VEPPKNGCARCGVPLGFTYEIDTGASYLCGACRTEDSPFAELRYAFGYEGPARNMMLALKFRGERRLAKTMAQMARSTATPLLDAHPDALLVPTPLARSKLFSRGYNPPYPLAQAPAKESGHTVTEGALRRTRSTRPQYGLSSKERAKNVRGAFSVTNPGLLHGRTLILIDDIYTTGATVNECCKALKKAEPEKIAVFAFCRTI